jgi:predicted small lipoprotein YifL
VKPVRCYDELRVQPGNRGLSLRFALVGLALGVSALVGCGQTGPLTLPGGASAGANATAGAGASANTSPNATDAQSDGEDAESGEDGAENER